MPDTPFPHPKLEDYFIPASCGRFITRRHPYDFIETYMILQELFGYQTHYVNLGYWGSGAKTTEPGRELAIALADLIGITPDQTICEVGSGLGQAAVDLCRTYDLISYVGLNINARQVAFANALASAERIDNRIVHVLGDACNNLSTLKSSAYSAIIAIECVGHFHEPNAFLCSAYDHLLKGGKIAFCLNVAKTKLSPLQRYLFYLAFGFVPASLQTWTTRLRQAGFRNISIVDWTETVLVSSVRFARARITKGEANINPLIARYLALQLDTALQSALRGHLGYFAVTATNCNDT